MTRAGQPTPPLKRLCAMHERRGQRGKGRRMLVGYVDGRKPVIFHNPNAKGGDPGWTAFVSERQDSAA